VSQPLHPPMRRLGGGLNPAVMEAQNRGFTPTAEEVEDARWVLERHRELAGTGDTWIAIDGRVIDRYEAARARDTLAQPGSLALDSPPS
jgi:citrate lyase beta subunit